MKRELDVSCLMSCPEEGCDGVLLRISLPSENGRYQCITCGLITWDTVEMQSSNLDVGQTLRVDLTCWTPTMTGWTIS